MSEMSGLGRSRLTSVQQLGRGLQQDRQARRRDDALSRLWDEVNSSIRTREQVQHRRRCVTHGDVIPRTELRVTVCPVSLQSLQAAREIHQFHHDVDELKGWMAEKEAVLDSEDQDLHSIQTLLRQHEALEVGNTQQAGRTLSWRGIYDRFSCTRSNC